jgi:hypothetical protein
MSFILSLARDPTLSPCEMAKTQSQNELNYQRLNKKFGQTDTGLGDCNFILFSRHTNGGGICLVIVG